MKANATKLVPATKARKVAKYMGGTVVKPMEISGKHSAHKNITRTVVSKSVLTLFWPLIAANLLKDIQCDPFSIYFVCNAAKMIF
jgi:hypothetical protein